MAPPHPALVLLEFQRQWTDPGVYRRLLEPDLTRRNVVDAAVNAYVVTDCTETFSSWLQRRARKRFGGRALTLRQARDMLEGAPQ
jgi:hypothetical protein